MKTSKRSTSFALAFGVALLGAVAGASAQAPEIAARQDVMKANIAAMRVLIPIVRGQTPWDATSAAAAAQAAATIQSDAEKGKLLFPAGSTAPNSRATAAIWERKAEFDAIFDRQRAAASELVRLANANNEAGFKAGFAAVGETCDTCHTAFRRAAN